MKIAFTVCNRSQLSHALCLGESIRTHAPDRQFILGWADRAPIVHLPDWVKLIRIESLPYPDWQAMSERYYDFELVAALRPFFGRFILKEYPECRQLIHLSPTTVIVTSLDQALNSGSFFQVTPHRLAPLGKNSTLKDRHILNIGMYHAGSWVMQPDGNQEHLLLDWWCSRTRDRAHFDLCAGMCMDQLWLNYLPIYYNEVQTIRHEGWHYGLHRISGTQIQKTGNGYSVNGQPLITLDMAGLESYHPVWSDHTTLAEGNPLWNDLRKEYRRHRGHYASNIPVDNLPYGKPSYIKAGRQFRKKGVSVLNQLIHKIETFNLTYN